MIWDRGGLSLFVLPHLCRPGRLIEARPEQAPTAAPWAGVGAAFLLSWLTVALCVRRAKEGTFDVIVVQEPYASFGKCMGYDSYRADAEGVKVVILVKIGTRCWLRREWTNANVVAVEMEMDDSRRGNVLIVGMYDEPPDAGGSNAKNEALGGNVTDLREEEVLEAAIRGGWRIENEPGDPPSFCSNRGRSWVDLVITKGIQVVDREVVVEEESLSDHRYVELIAKVEKKRKEAGGKRYIVKGVDWTGSRGSYEQGPGPK